MLKKRSIESVGSAPSGGEEDSKKINFEARVEKAKAVSLNRDIAKFARQKDLTSAKDSFQTAISNEWANSHTFSAIINAHVRCGDISGAKDMYDLLKKTKNVRIDVVSCTTLMKGFASVGDMKSCDTIMRDMCKANPPIAPNVRTINTYLRGCLMSGAVASAERMFARMQSEFKINPDISSWEYVVALLCQALMLDKALPMIGRVKGDPSLSGGVGAMYVNLARAAALLGEFKACKKALRQATECLNIDEERQMAQEEEGMGKLGGDSEDDEDGSGDEGKTDYSKQSRPTLGGKQAWKLEEDDARMQSLEIYKEHRRSELRQEIQAITAYIATNDRCNVDTVLGFYNRVFSFDLASFSAAGAISKDQVVDELLLARLSKFGQHAALSKKHGNMVVSTKDGTDYHVLRHLAPSSQAAVKGSDPTTTEGQSGKNKKKGKGKGKKGKKGDDTDVPPPGVLVRIPPQVTTAVNAARSSLEECVDSNGRLLFSRIFGSDIADSESGDVGEASFPIKMEICSGGGEWAVKQAMADIGKANWITAEIRHDRVYQTFTRAIFEGASNLAVFGGDANEMLSRRIPPGSIQYVCVNYPEPPQQLGGENSQGKHLLTVDFFAAVEQVLKPDGMCTIVTDNLWYGRLLLRTIASASYACSLTNAVLESSGQYEVQDEASGFVLRKGKPGAECGHVTDASSYFDRLWKRGRQTDRYFLALKNNGGGVTAASVASAGSRGSLPGNVSQSTKRSGIGLPRGGSGKKIKFDD